MSSQLAVVGSSHGTAFRRDRLSAKMVNASRSKPVAKSQLESSPRRVALFGWDVDVQVPTTDWDCGGTASPSPMYVWWAALPESHTNAANDQVKTAIDEALTLDIRSRHREAVRVVVRQVEEWLNRRAFGELNAALNGLNPDQCSPWPTITLLRTSFRAAEQLPAWAHAVGRAKDSFDKRGLSSASMLAGLLAD